MPDLLVRFVDEAVVEALRKRAGAHGRSPEAEHRKILEEVLLYPGKYRAAPASAGGGGAAAVTKAAGAAELDFGNVMPAARARSQPAADSESDFDDLVK